jgi:hypothetical protein
MAVIVWWFELQLPTVSITTDVVSSNLDQGCVQDYVIKFVSNLRPVGGFLGVLRFPPPVKLFDITDILLKVVLNTIKPTRPNLYLCRLILCSFVFVLTCLHMQYFMHLCALILYFFGWLLFNVKLALPLFLLYCWHDQACT